MSSLTPSHCIWNRAESRARVAMEAVIETDHGYRPGYLLNLSCHGAMVQTTLPPARQHFVLLKCGPLDEFGMVAWVEQDRFGIQFDEPISEDLVITLRRMGDLIDRGPPSQGRPGLRGRPLTAAEMKAAEDWAVSSAIR